MLEHTLGDTTRKRLTDADVMALLRTGQTYAAEVIGDLPLNYLEALSEGLTPDYRASVLGENNRLPRQLAQQGGTIRVAPMPVSKDRWQLQVFQSQGVLQLTGHAQTLEQAVLIPAEAEVTPTITNFGLYAPFDGVSFSSSWAAHPHQLRAEYMAMMGRPRRYYSRLTTEVRLLPGIRVLQGILALLSGMLTGLYLLRGEPVTLGVIAIVCGLVSTGCYFYVRHAMRRLKLFIGAESEGT